MNHKRLSARGALAPLFTSLFAALVPAGCSTTPTFEPVAPPAAPLAFEELDGLWAALGPAEAQARGEWWKSFADRCSTTWWRAPIATTPASSSRRLGSRRPVRYCDRPMPTACRNSA